MHPFPFPRRPPNRRRRATPRPDTRPNRPIPDGSGPGGSTPDGSTPDRSASTGDAAEQPALPPFNRRIKLLVEILDERDEIGLAVQLFQDQGWLVRPATPEDHPTTRPAFTALVVEVRLRGARWRARSAAYDQARSLVEEKKLAAWVRDTALIQPEWPRTFVTYHAHRTTPDGVGRLTRWLLRHWQAAGGTDTGRTLVLPGTPPPEEARAELAQRPLGGLTFDPATQDARPALGPRRPARTPPPDPDDDSNGTPGPARLFSTALLVGVAVGLVLLQVAGGWAAWALPGGWRALGLAPAAVFCWPIGAWVTSNTRPPFLLRLAVGAVLTGGPTWMGFLLARESVAGGPARQALLVLAVVGGLGAAVGTWHAISHSWVSRNANWLVPGLVFPLSVLLPVAGRLLHTLFLTDVFGIPEDAVPVAFYWQYLVALKPMAVGAAVIFLLVGITGWVRYFHWLPRSPVITLVMWPLVLLIYVLTVLQVSLDDTATAADRVAERARAGQAPGSYYGINGTLVCLRPLGDDIPVLNGPLPTAHPVLSFGTSGDHLWIWDPRKPGGTTGADTPRGAVRVRTEDVTVTEYRGSADGRRPDRGSDGGCPGEAG